MHGATFAPQHALELRSQSVEQILEGLFRTRRGLHRDRPPRGTRSIHDKPSPAPGTTRSPGATLPCPVVGTRRGKDAVGTTSLRTSTRTHQALSWFPFLRAVLARPRLYGTSLRLLRRTIP